MLRFILRRAASTAIVSVVIIFFVYLGMSMVPNSRVPRPEYNLAQRSIGAWQDTRALLFGHTPLPQAGLLWQAYINSMGLLLVALVSAAILGLWIGGAAALTRKRRLTLPLLALTIVGISTPSFLAALLLQVGELRFLHTFGRRLVSMAGFGWDFEHMFMPVVVLAALPLAYLTRAAFLALSRVMEEDYMRTALSKGLSKRQAVNAHALRNVAIPALTAIGVSIRFSLSTLPVVEVFFAWPGMGRRLLEAIDTRQTTVVVILATALGLTFLLVNLVLDIAYRLVDPRTRESP
jgi:ABC-type dipeptide/oligopeptide/nickel transport system permease component